MRSAFAKKNRSAYGENPFSSDLSMSPVELEQPVAQQCWKTRRGASRRESTATGKIPARQNPRRQKNVVNRNRLFPATQNRNNRTETVSSPDIQLCIVSLFAERNRKNAGGGDFFTDR